jgi:hypothetical protein
MAFIDNGVSASLKKRKANQDEVVDQICACIIGDGAPFHGEVDTLTELKDKLSTANSKDSLSGQRIIGDLEKAVGEEWFNDVRATKLVPELIQSAK